jgi:hypothetical protein
MKMFWHNWNQQMAMPCIMLWNVDNPYYWWYQSITPSSLASTPTFNLSYIYAYLDVPSHGPSVLSGPPSISIPPMVSKVTHCSPMISNLKSIQLLCKKFVKIITTLNKWLYFCLAKSNIFRNRLHFLFKPQIPHSTHIL